MAYPTPNTTAGLFRIMAPVKKAIASEVSAIFNDRDRGERPVMRRGDGWFNSSSVVWRVHGDIAGMMVGGIAALMLQMLHPAVLAGVWDHSQFRSDLNGRLRRTARFIALTTYSSADQTEAAIARVRKIHGFVGGTLPTGEPYNANDPELLAWVHVTEATSFLEGWVRYAEPKMTLADQNQYFAEIARVGRALGADPVPTTKAQARRLINDMRPALLVDDRTREVARILLNKRADNPIAEPLQQLTMQSGLDLLPDWARRMHGIPRPPFRPLLRAGTLGVARTLRWAFA